MSSRASFPVLVTYICYSTPLHLSSQLCSYIKPDIIAVNWIVHGSLLWLQWDFLSTIKDILSSRKNYVLDPISIKNLQNFCLHLSLASLLLFLSAFHATSVLTWYVFCSESFGWNWADHGSSPPCLVPWNYWSRLTGFCSESFCIMRCILCYEQILSSFS